MKRPGMWGLVALLAVVGCNKKGDDGAAPSQRSAAKDDTVRSAAKGAALVGGQGQLLAAGRAADLRLSPDGQFATYLLNGQKPRLDGIPPQMLVGALYVVPVAGGKPRALGDGVTNVPGSLLFSADSRHLLYVTGYNPASQSGELHALALTDAAAEPATLGTAVSYLLPSPDGVSVAFVDGGVLKLGPLPAGPFQDVAAEVSTAQFTPDGKTLLFKRRLSAASGLAAVTVGSNEPPRKLADQVGDYEVSSDGKRVAYQVRSEAVRGMYDLYLADVPALKGQRLAVGSKVFGFSPDGQWLARTENGKPEQLGDLYVGPASGGPGRKVGEAVEEMAFAPDSKAVGFLEKYDQPSRAGAMSVATLPDGAPKRVGDRVPNFVWGSDSRYVAFLSRFVKPVFSVDLMLYALGQEKAEKVQPGVFGYGFMPNNGAVVFRTNCIRNGRACDFKALDLGEKQTEAKTWMQGIFSYKISNDGARILATYARMDSDTYDVAVYDVKTGARKTLDQGVQVPTYFAGKDDARAVYIIGQGQNPGVYSAIASPQ
ncbi:gliding motility protein [Corallococcus praedator]|uniref:Gliding motility protein n=1 Tax=Corallococcus praedator TaxID=2316724 RepID=A0ABX9QNK2_9BACT|nr:MULTISPECIES: gliding motility protein [Corallococcus]RKH10295.1 gliding motility protein [Corallococcus sp. CA047B]RKH26265.1 gliding motility protein [Corallococcus sp. CA031C]RKI12522.1 gliding motility protein [Corallococcus praedator]